MEEEKVDERENGGKEEGVISSGVSAEEEYRNEIIRKRREERENFTWSCKPKLKNLIARWHYLL